MVLSSNPLVAQPPTACSAPSKEFLGDRKPSTNPLPGSDTSCQPPGPGSGEEEQVRTEIHNDRFDFTFVGNPLDKTTAPLGGAALIGGSTDPDPAFRWLGEHAQGGDVLVISASEDEGYNNYISSLVPTNSVSTLVVHSPEASSDPFVLQQVRKAEAIFFCGGDQADYFRDWKDTPLQAELNAALAHGVTVGGTSAGLAILAQHPFVALTGGVSSPAALSDPKNADMTLADEFLHVPTMDATVTDTHFAARDRMGRFLAFVADNAEVSLPSRGIAVDEKTAVLVEANGQASVTGPGSAYFVDLEGPPQQCEAGKPLALTDVPVYRLQEGGQFDLVHWQGQGGLAYQLSAENGALRSSQPDGAVY